MLIFLIFVVSGVQIKESAFPKQQIRVTADRCRFRRNLTFGSGGGCHVSATIRCGFHVAPVGGKKRYRKWKSQAKRWKCVGLTVL